MNLGAGVENQDDSNAEGTERREIEEDVGEVLRSDDSAIQDHNKGAPLELRHVAEDGAEIAELHVAWGGGEQPKRFSANRQRQLRLSEADAETKTTFPGRRIDLDGGDTGRCGD